MPPGGTSSLHFDSSGFTPLFRNRSVPSRRESLHFGPRYLAIRSSSGARSDAALLWRTAAVVRNRRHVLDAGYFQAGGVERPHGRFTSRPRPAHAHLDRPDTPLLRRRAGALRGDLRRERRALARAAETAAPRGRPGERVALPVGDGHDRVVERGVHVRDRIGHLPLRLLAHLGRTAGRCRTLLLLVVRHTFQTLVLFDCLLDPTRRDQTLPGGAFSLTAALRGPLRVRALVRVRWPRIGSPLRWRMPR